MVVTSQTFSLLPLVVKIEYFTSNMSIQGKYKLGDGVGINNLQKSLPNE